MIKENSLLGRFFFEDNPSRAEREEKVLRYIIHRMDQDGAFQKVLEESYVAASPAPSLDVPHDRPSDRSDRK